MSNENRDQASRLKSLTDDFEQRLYDLKHFDAASEINSHCDDLIGEVELTIESAMDHLNKVRTRMATEINDYRANLLDTAGEQQSDVQESFTKLSREAADFRSATSDSASCNVSDEALDKMDGFIERASDLRRKMRAQAFKGRFMRFLQNDFLEGDVIGSIKETRKDVLDDFGEDTNHEMHWPAFWYLRFFFSFLI